MPTFPTVSLLDSFKRAFEATLSNGGKWTIIGGVIRAGEIAGGGQEFYTAASGFEEGADGAYWNPVQFTNPGVCVLMNKVPNANEREGTLYCCMSTPGTGERNGYRLRVTQMATNEKFNVRLERIDKATPTVLKLMGEVVFKAGDSFGISVSNGQVIAWRKKGGEAWEVLTEVADANYTTGYVGIGVRGSGAVGLRNFEAGNGPTSHSHTLSVSQTQEVSRVTTPARTLTLTQAQAAKVTGPPHRHEFVLTQAQVATRRTSPTRGLSISQGQTATLTKADVRTSAGLLTMVI